MKTITIVIPCYNEEHRLPSKKLLDFVQKHEQVYLLLVNDGSKDQTLKVIGQLAEQNRRILTLNLQENGGKSEAVRKGMLRAKEMSGEIIAFIDADLATPPEEVLYLEEKMRGNHQVVMAFGSRLKTLSNTIERKLSRHLTGRVFATFTSNSLKLPIYDTQCGCKLFKKEVIDLVFQKPFLSAWMFDVEIFWRLIHHFGREKMSTIALEVPLRKWIDPGDSKITWKDTLKFPFEFIKIHRHYRKNKS